MTAFIGSLPKVSFHLATAVVSRSAISAFRPRATSAIRYFRARYYATPGTPNDEAVAKILSGKTFKQLIENKEVYKI